MLTGYSAMLGTISFLNYSFVFPNKDSAYQNPVRFKSTGDDRMAFYW
jgi:hypothetical protein